MLVFIHLKDVTMKKYIPLLFVFILLFPLPIHAKETIGHHTTESNLIYIYMMACFMSIFAVYKMNKREEE